MVFIDMAASKTAKFFGGVALSGTAKQKKWAEDIRESVITSSLDQEYIDQLLTVGGIFNTSKFWIDNRNVSHEKFIPSDICAELNGLKELEEKHWEFLVRTNPTGEKEKRRNEIRQYLASCRFNLSGFCGVSL